MLFLLSLSLFIFTLVNNSCLEYFDALGKFVHILVAGLNVQSKKSKVPAYARSCEALFSQLRDTPTQHFYLHARKELELEA